MSKTNQQYYYTTNRTVYNKLHKRMLASCDFCSWHCGENARGKKWYGLVHQINGKVFVTYPSWKLVSKNKKQWMYKHNLRKKHWTSQWGSCGYEFKF